MQQRYYLQVKHIKRQQIIFKDCSTKELAEISKRISDAIANGKFSINGDGCLQYETTQRLEELGYKVETGSQYNEQYWSISWK